MIQPKSKAEMPTKLGALPQEEMLTIQVKNTMLRLNGQNLKLAAKNGRNPKTPGLHLSATQEKTEGRLTTSSATQLGTAKTDTFKLPRPNSERSTTEKRPVRRPLKLAPLDLPEEVWVAQKEKLKFSQQEAQATSCKPDASPKPRRLKSSFKPSSESLQSQLDTRTSRPQLSRCHHEEEFADKNLKDVVCRGTPAPFCSKPAPPSLNPRIKAACIGEAAHHRSSGPQQEAGRGRRLRRVQCIEEDHCNLKTSMGGLLVDGGKMGQGVQNAGQQTDKAGKGIRECSGKARHASRERRTARKSHREDGAQRSAGCSLNRQSDESGRGERGLGGVEPSASNCRLKSRKLLITKQNNAVPVERLHM